MHAILRSGSNCGFASRRRRRTSEGHLIIEVVHAFGLAPLIRVSAALALERDGRERLRLEIVQHHDIDEKNFFTLSSFGVTQMLNGSPEFTELEQWKREHYLFNAISKIPVFRMYRTWKSYKVWRDSVRYGKMKKSAKALQKNLFKQV